MSFSSEQSYLFQLIVIYRRTIPSNDLFYIIFFFFKFNGAFLITHNINGKENNVFSLHTILRYLTFLSNGAGFMSSTYVFLSIFLLIFLVVFILLYIIIILSIKHSKKKMDLSLFKSKGTTDITLSSETQAFFKGMIYVYIVIVFLSQFLSELLVFSIVPLIYDKGSIPNGENEKIMQTLEAFINKMPMNNYFLLGVNMISLCIIILFLFVFFYLSTSLTLEKINAFNINIEHFGIALLVICCQLQSLYTLTNYFTDPLKTDIKFWLCLITICYLLLCFLFNLRQYNHSEHIIVYLINFSFNLCLISGIMELIISKAFIGPLSQIDSILKLLFEILNAVFLTSITTKIKKQYQLTQFVDSIFNEHIGNQNYQSIEEFAFILTNDIDRKVDFIQMFQLFEAHRVKCLNDKCKCHKIHGSFKKKSKENQIKDVMNTFVLLGEGEIVNLINHYREKNPSSSVLKRLYIIHVDYVKSVKKNYFLALYLAKWYQESKTTNLNLLGRFLLYELEEDIIALINNWKITNQDNVRLESLTNKTRKTHHHQSHHHLLLNTLFNEKLITLLHNCLIEMEKFSYYRNVVRMNLKSSFKCEDFIKPIMNYTEEYESVIDLLDNYFKYNKEIPSESIELSYLLQYFFILFQGELPHKYQGRITLLVKYQDYLKFNIYAHKYMILVLTNDDTIVIRYISIQLAEQLLFSKEDLIGKDIHDMLIPSHLAPYHFIYVKGFMLEGISTFEKITYMINKEKNIRPYHFSSKILPSISKRICLILKMKEYYHPIQKKNIKDKENTYYLCLDYYFNILSTSENFIRHFVFTLRMFHTLKLNLCTFFGIKQEELMHYFNGKINKKTNKKGKEIKRSMLTTIQSEKDKMYQNVLHYFNKQDENKFEKEVHLSKERAISYIKRIEKSIDERGLDKDWNDKINDLCSRLSLNSTIAALTNNNLMYFDKSYNTSSMKNGDKLSFVFELRHIGNLYYYIVVFHHKTMESTLFKSEGTITPNEDRRNDGRTGVFSTPKNIYGSLIDERRTHHGSNNDITSKESSYIELNSRKELNQSNSRQILHGHSQRINYKQRMDFAILKSSFKDTKIALHKIFLIKRKAVMLRIFQLIIFIVLIILSILNFAMNASFVSISLNLFYINTNAFLLSADIFFTSLGCLRACLIQEEMQNGSIEDYEDKIAYHTSELLEHFQVLLHIVHKIADSPQATIIYDVLTTENEYSILLPSWQVLTRQSIFREEIFYFHYLVSNFHLSQSKSCRLKLFLANSLGTIQENNEATIEERISYYIITNIISKMTVSLHELTRVTNIQLTEYSRESKVNLVIFNILILMVALTLYFSLFGYIVLLKRIYRIIMSQFFFKSKGEDEFNGDIERLKRVLLHFNMNECRLFEGTKGKSNPYFLKASESVSGPSFYSNNQSYNTSSFQINNAYNSSSNNSTVNMQHQQQHQSSKMFKNGSSHSKHKSSQLNHKSSLGEKGEVIVKKNQVDSELNDFYKKTINKLSNMKLMQIMFIIIIAVFLIYSALQISNIIIVTSYSTKIVTENIFTTFFLIRIPKFAELVLYTEISVLANSFILVDPRQSENSLDNFYNIDIKDLENSFFISLHNKNFIKLYQQLYIIRQNLSRFLNDATKANMFPIVQQIETKYQSKEFCSEVGVRYTISLYNDQINAWPTFFSDISHFGGLCRKFGSGVNLSGLKIVFDLLIQHLYVLYVEYEKNVKELPAKEAQEVFMKDDLLELIVDNLQETMGSAHKSFAFFVLKDMEKSYKDKYSIEIIFSIASIVVSCGVFVVLMMIILRTFEKYNWKLEVFWLRLDKAIGLKQMDVQPTVEALLGNS